MSSSDADTGDYTAMASMTSQRKYGEKQVDLGEVVMSEFHAEKASQLIAVTGLA